MQRKRILVYLLAVITATAVILIYETRKSVKENEKKVVPRDYPEISESGILRAVTEYNAVSYHIKDGLPEGFDFDLLTAFAKEYGLQLEITPEMSFDKRFEGTCKGIYDVLATGTLVTSHSRDSLLFTRHILTGKQVLVQRKNEGKDTTVYISNQLQLGGKKLYITAGSPGLLRIHHLIDEIADTIYVEQVEGYGPEQLMAMVAGGDIDYAVCEESIARATLPAFSNLDINTDISFTQFYAWGVNRRSHALLDTLDRWLGRYMQTEEYGKLYKKYFN